MVHEAGERFSAVLQSLDMGDESTSLDREGEIIGGAPVPAFENLFIRQTIEGDIQLHRIEMPGVVFKPLPLGETGGVKDILPPMRVVIAARSNEDLIFDCAVYHVGYTAALHPTWCRAD